MSDLRAVGRPGNAEVLEIVTAHGPLTVNAIANACRASPTETDEVIRGLEKAGELVLESGLWTIRNHG